MKAKFELWPLNIFYKAPPPPPPGLYFLVESQGREAKRRENHTVWFVLAVIAVPVGMNGGCARGQMSLKVNIGMGQGSVRRGS